MKLTDNADLSLKLLSQVIYVLLHISVNNMQDLNLSLYFVQILNFYIYLFVFFCALVEKVVMVG